MPPLELTPQQIAALVGTRHPETGYERPELGLQPYYHWLIRSLERLSDASVGQLRVTRDDTSAMHVHVAAGVVRFGANPRSVAAQSMDLTTFNNQTALIAVQESAGEAVVSAASSTTGWPGSDHLKLAEVTIDAGTIINMIDRRLDALFTAGG